jgi:peptidoglycan/xylan/chitin deacetylase (PgdA/CDA1 family)
MLRIIAALVLAPVLVAAQSPVSGSAQRRLAVTIDDLPWVGRESGDSVVVATDRLLAAIIGWRVPTVGFVIQAHAERRDRPDHRTHLLDRWLAAGVEMGNHTYGHRSANLIPQIAFLAEIVRGEPLISRLSRQSGRPLRYFRHPYLHLGPDTAYRDGVARFLTSRGYLVAPVTIETRDYMFSSAYAAARIRGDAGLERRVVEAYLAHLAHAAEFSEEFSRDLIGYEPPQVILLHANRLNADHLGRVLELFRARGYRFVTLDEALRDPAYSLPDGYRGLKGVSWTHRWAAGLGREPRTEPEPPPWVSSVVSGPAGVSAASRRR